MKQKLVPKLRVKNTETTLRSACKKVLETHKERL